MAKAKKSDRLFEIFAGEYVAIIIDQSMEQTVTNGETLQTVKSPLSVQGYLTDEDDTYLYLGHTPEQFHHAVKKDMVVHVEIGEEKTALDELIESGELPEREEEYN